jgi:hypothetical protein
MAFEYTGFAVSGDPNLKLVVYMPVNEHDTRSRLRALLTGAPAPKPLPVPAE